MSSKLYLLKRPQKDGNIRVTVVIKLEGLQTLSSIDDRPYGLAITLPLPTLEQMIEAMKKHEPQPILYEEET